MVQKMAEKPGYFTNKRTQPSVDWKPPEIQHLFGVSYIYTPIYVPGDEYHGTWRYFLGVSTVVI